MDLIDVTDLVKVYHVDSVEIRALRGLNLHVDAGEMAAVIGPSGSGKSTLLNVLGGLTRSTAGTVEVSGIDLNSLTRKQMAEYRLHTVGHIFQSLNLVPILTAFENVELPLVAAGVKRTERKRRVTELLEKVGLSRRTRHRPGQLSGGEQQRVAIAAALANNPPILLADEPTGELDSTNAAEIVELLCRMNQEDGKTIVLVTHDPNVARKTHRILPIQDGVFIGAYSPISLAEARDSASYVENLRRRIEEVKKQLVSLDQTLKRRSVSGSKYAKERQRLETVLSVLQDEIRGSGTST
jgi:putative ABC transport system ATP-binding protein